MDVFKELPLKKQTYMEMLFQNCTEEVKYYMRVMEVDENETLIKAGEKCSNIYIILSGKVTGIEWPMNERPYYFKDYGPGYQVPGACHPGGALHGMAAQRRGGAVSSNQGEHAQAHFPDGRRPEVSVYRRQGTSDDAFDPEVRAETAAEKGAGAQGKQGSALRGDRFFRKDSEPQYQKAQ